jgi:predicted acetyltransferase
MLESYTAALRSGWSPNNSRDVSSEQLAAIEADSAAFLASLTEMSAMTTLPDGSVVPKLPYRVRWMWDGDFCGVISLRYQPGTDALPLHIAGHIGYAVVPWKRKHGYASRALKQILSEAREVGLRQVAITTEPENIASRTVIERNGGVRAGAWSHARFPDTGVLDRFVIRL